MLFQHGFVQLVSAPTHHYVSNGVHKESVIDLILTNSKSCQNVSGVMPCSLSPDHDLVYVVRQHVNNKKGPAKTITYRPIKSCDEYTYKTIIDKLASAPWWILDLCPNVDEVFRVIQSTIVLILDQTIPNKTVKVKTNQPKWLTPEFKRLIHVRDNAKKQFISSKSRETWARYQSLRKNVNAAKRKLKASELKRAVQSLSQSTNKSKIEWKLFNQEIGRSKVNSKIVSLETKSYVATNDFDMANIFCDEFSKPLQSDILNFDCVLPVLPVLPVLGRDFSDTLNYIEFSDSTVQEGLSRINQHKCLDL